MPHKWTFYALNKFISVDKLLIETLEDILDITLHCKIQIEGRPTNDDDDHTVTAKISGEPLKVYMTGNKSFTMPMILAVTSELDSVIEQLIEALKDATGVIIWPIINEPTRMIAFADWCVWDQWYDTRLIFQSEDKMLNNYSIEISRYSCEKLCDGDSSIGVYSNHVIPYIYSQTGMEVAKLPISYIILQSLMTITTSGVTTLQRRLKHDILLGLLKNMNLGT